MGRSPMLTSPVVSRRVPPTRPIDPPHFPLLPPPPPSRSHALTPAFAFPLSRLTIHPSARPCPPLSRRGGGGDIARGAWRGGRRACCSHAPSRAAHAASSPGRSAVLATG
eukprot:3612341-Pleurochrysis_carterae.AAC.1